MDRVVTTTIDPERCTGCGLCVRVCPARTLVMQDGKAVVAGDESLNCGHCQAVCPVGAVRVGAVDPDMAVFSTFTSDAKWLGFGKFDVAELTRLMASRRSCRNYTEAPVDRSVLEDLIKIGITAPSGTNSQRWTFTILPDRETVLELANRIGAFFRRLNFMAEKWVIRNGMKLLGKKELDVYYREYYESVAEGLREWRETGRERLFHGATAAIVVASRPGASCPAEDALLATQNILLAAHAMGLGTCLIGFAVEAMKNNPGIKHAIGIPKDETVYAVIALGHPDEKYRHVAGRKKALIRYVDH